jgi:protein-S-isoprenylcysteine O-methyltransferase Ste14
VHVTLYLKTFIFLLVVPGTVAAFVPMALVTFIPSHMPLASGSFLRFSGIALMALGAGVYSWCAIDLARLGKGIPAPTDPTRALVRGGLYQYLRNPMYMSGSLVLYGEALAFSEGVILLYAFAVSLLQHLAVVYLEEPALRERFGEPYERYCARVPRWLFRLTAANMTDGVQ